MCGARTVEPHGESVAGECGRGGARTPSHHLSPASGLHFPPLSLAHSSPQGLEIRAPHISTLNSYQKSSLLKTADGSPVVNESRLSVLDAQNDSSERGLMGSHSQPTNLPIEWSCDGGFRHSGLWVLSALPLVCFTLQALPQGSRWPPAAVGSPPAK